MLESPETFEGRSRRWWHKALVWAFAFAMLLPFAQMIWTAQKPRSRVDGAYYYLAQRMPEREVRRRVDIDPRPLRVAVTNSLVVSLICSVSGVVLASLAGYAFAKKRFAGRAALFDLVLVSMAMPAAVLMMPLFRLTVILHIYDTLLALILPFAVTGYGIFYMRHAISSVPDSVLDCGRIDGLSEWGVLFRVVLPAIRSSVLTLFVLLFLSTWSLFVLPHAVVASPRNYTVGILLGRLMTDYGGLMWNDIMIVVIAAAVPLLLVYLVFHPLVMRGLAAVGDRRSKAE